MGCEILPPLKKYVLNCNFHFDEFKKCSEIFYKSGMLITSNSLVNQEILEKCKLAVNERINTIENALELKHPEIKLGILSHTFIQYYTKRILMFCLAQLSLELIVRGLGWNI